MKHRSTALAIAAVLTAAALALSGCSGADDAAQVAVTTGPTASEAPASGAELDAPAFAAALKLPGTTILDVRTPQEYAQGHLPGAVNVDVSAPDFAARIATLDPQAPYAVYCRSGNRSAAALSAMATQGFTGAYHLGGGIGAWQDAGGEVVTG